MKQKHQGVRIGKIFFDFKLENKATGDSMLHYACRYPSLAIVIETLADRLVDPICLNDCL